MRLPARAAAARALTDHFTKEWTSATAYARFADESRGTYWRYRLLEAGRPSGVLDLCSASPRHRQRSAQAPCWPLGCRPRRSPPIGCPRPVALHPLRTGRECGGRRNCRRVPEAVRAPSVRRRRTRRSAVFGLKIRDVDLQPVAAAERRCVRMHGAQIDARPKHLQCEVLHHLVERTAPARAGEIIEAPIRIQYGDAVVVEPDPHPRLEHRQVDRYFGARGYACGRTTGRWTAAASGS